jgi:hypothetical protein
MVRTYFLYRIAKNEEIRYSLDSSVTACPFDERDCFCRNHGQKVHCFTGNHTLHCLDLETIPLSFRRLFEVGEKPQPTWRASPRTSHRKRPLEEHGTIFREASAS